MKVQALTRHASVDRLLTVTVVLSEVLRAYPWLLLLSGIGIAGWTESPLSFLSSLVIISAVALILSVGLSRGLHVGEVRVATLSVGIILIVLLTRLENSGGYAFWDPAWITYASSKTVALMASLAFGFFLVWRGIAISRDDLRTDYLYRNFVIGIASFVLLLIIWSAAIGSGKGQSLFTTVFPYIFGYFFMSLMGMGVSNFLSLRKGLGSRPKATDLFARRWLLLLLGVVLVITLIGSLIASGVSLNLIGIVLTALNTAAGWLAIGFLYVLGYPIGYILAGVEWLGRLIIGWLMSLINAKPFQPPEFSDAADNANQIQTGQVPDTIFMIVKWVLFAALVAVIVYFLWKTIYRYWKGPQEKGYEEVHESLWNWNDFTGDLKSFLKNFADRFRRPEHATPPLASTITEPQFLDVRELYRGLLWEGAQKGHPKYHSQTPYEYRASLENAVSGQTESIEAITDAYVRDRYGHVSASHDEGMSLVRIWLKLRSALRGNQDSAPN